MTGFVMAGRPLLLPTAYFPPVAHYACLASGLDIIIEQAETFPKQTCRNRCEIMTVSGKFSLIIPVSKPNGKHTLTKDIRINDRQSWRRNHWRALQTAYNSSPFFQYYSERIMAIFELDEPSLILYNRHIINCLNELIGIKPVITFSASFEKTPVWEIDLRNLTTPKKIIPELDYPEYPQVFKHIHGFIPGLSILDLLFNLGPESKRYLEILRRQIIC